MSYLEWIALACGGIATIPTLILFVIYRKKQKEAARYRTVLAHRTAQLDRLAGGYTGSKWREDKDGA